MRRLRIVTMIPLAAVACGTALNYLDPSGPMYETRHAAPYAAQPPRSLRVVTFNIENAVHVDRAIAVLKATESLQGLDLLALQEMDAPGVERIAIALGLNSLYFPSAVTPKTNKDIGCALLSPWPLVEPRKVMLPHGARATGLRRAAVGATLLRGERRLRVYAVHLPAPFGISGDDLHDEVLTLLADADSSPDPVVIAGDLNSHGLGEQFVKRFRSHLHQGDASGHTRACRGRRPRQPEGERSQPGVGADRHRGSGWRDAIAAQANRELEASAGPPRSSAAESVAGQKHPLRRERPGEDSSFLRTGATYGLLQQRSRGSLHRRLRVARRTLKGGPWRA
jgi:endonuclease/exonuclease/phosphatase family metal-dependent hydrolase